MNDYSLTLLDDELQPPDIPGFYGSDGVCVKPMILRKAGTMVPQHSHEYAHTSYIATGSVRAWKDGVLMGDFIAPTGIEIEAHAKHRFLSLEDNTSMLCIHNVSRTGDIEVFEEHQLNIGSSSGDRWNHVNLNEGTEAEQASVR